MIPELHPIGYRTRQRRSSRGSGILIWSGGGGDKLSPSPLGRYDPALTFSTAYRSIALIHMTSFFVSQILLLNLVRGRMGPETTSFFILSKSVPSLLFHSPQMIYDYNTFPAPYLCLWLRRICQGNTRTSKNGIHQNTVG